VIWALDGRPVSSFDGRRALVLPNSSRAATYGIITREDTETLGKVETSRRASARIGSFLDADGAPYATLLELAPESVGVPRPAALWEGFAGLVGSRVSKASPHAGEPLVVTLDWLAFRPADRDYTVSVQLVGPPNPANGSPLWAQEDKQPAGESYPTTAWQEGETISEAYRLQIPTDAPRGEYSVQVSLYLLATGARVPAFDANGTRLADDAYPLFRIDVR
jgi:hypothetical protein